MAGNSDFCKLAETQGSSNQYLPLVGTHTWEEKSLFYYNLQQRAQVHFTAELSYSWVLTCPVLLCHPLKEMLSIPDPLLHTMQEVSVSLSLF